MITIILSNPRVNHGGDIVTKKLLENNIINYHDKVAIQVLHYLVV